MSMVSTFGATRSSRRLDWSDYQRLLATDDPEDPVFNEGEVMSGGRYLFETPRVLYEDPVDWDYDQPLGMLDDHPSLECEEFDEFYKFDEFDVGDEFEDLGVFRDPVPDFELPLPLRTQELLPESFLAPPRYSCGSLRLKRRRRSPNWSISRWQKVRRRIHATRRMMKRDGNAEMFAAHMDHVLAVRAVWLDFEAEFAD